LRTLVFNQLADDGCISIILTISIITKSSQNNANLTTTLPLNSKSFTESQTTNIDSLLPTTIIMSTTDQNKNTTSTPNKGK